MAVSATALTSLANAQAYLADTANAALLEDCIDGVSARIESWLNRKIVSQTFTELYWIPRSARLVLNQPYVTALTLLALDSEPAIRAKYTGSGTHANVEVTDTGVVQRSRSGATTTETSTLFSAQATTTLMVSTMDAVTGWEVSLMKDGPSAYLVRTGVRSTKDQEVQMEAWRYYEGDYTVDYTAGFIDFNCYTQWPYGARATFLGGSNGQMYISYVAGYAAIPADVELTCLEMLKEIWDSKRVNTALQSQSIGDYSQTIRASVDDNAKWVTRLTPYKRILP